MSKLVKSIEFNLLHELNILAIVVRFVVLIFIFIDCNLLLLKNIYAIFVTDDVSIELISIGINEKQL